MKDIFGVLDARKVFFLFFFVYARFHKYFYKNMQVTITFQARLSEIAVHGVMKLKYCQDVIKSCQNQTEKKCAFFLSPVVKPL